MMDMYTLTTAWSSRFFGHTPKGHQKAQREGKDKRHQEYLDTGSHTSCQLNQHLLDCHFTHNFLPAFNIYAV